MFASKSLAPIENIINNLKEMVAGLSKGFYLLTRGKNG